MIPKYLYQYTTIESIISILNYETIRFTRLDSLNDPLEGLVGEFSNLKQLVYISSWTASNEESLPMWSMYSRSKVNSSLDSGARIKVPINLFMGDSVDNLNAISDKLEAKKLSSGEWHIATKLRDAKQVELSEFVKNTILDKNSLEQISFITKVYGPSKVRYLRLDEYQNRVCVKLEDGGDEFYSFDPKCIGLEKVEDWSYEKEYRFWFTFPEVKQLAGMGGVLKFNDSIAKESKIDIPFNRNALREIEITVSPHISNENYEKLQSFIDEKRISINVVHSKIKTSK